MPSIARRLSHSLHALAVDLLDLLAPRECVSCLALHPTYPRERPVLCDVCAVSLDDAVDPPRGVIVPFAHGGAIADAVHRAKYGDEPFHARSLGALLAHALRNRPAVRAATHVVAVPLHRNRLAERGFNQAVEIARGFEKTIVFGAIERVRDTRSQVGLARDQRAANVRSAFGVVDPRPLRGRAVMIVDDVVTTGATLNEVVAQVRAAGAASVTAVALVRAPLDRIARS